MALPGGHPVEEMWQECSIVCHVLSKAGRVAAGGAALCSWLQGQRGHISFMGVEPTHEQGLVVS